MSCDRARKWMVLADILSKEEQVELQRHLQECKPCSSEWHKWQRLFALLNRLPTISSTPKERAELTKALQHVQFVPELTCEVAKSHIWRWIDGDLSEQEVSSLVVHLANCDHCQSSLWQAEQTVQLLRLLPQLRATATEKEALKARLRRMGKRPSVVPFVWRFALPFAAAVILLLFTVSRWHAPSEDTSIHVAQSLDHQPSPTVKQPKLKPVQPPMAHEHKPSQHPIQSHSKPEIKVAKPTKQEQLPVPEKPKPVRLVKAQKPAYEKVLTAPEVSKLEAETKGQKFEQKVSEPETAVAKVSEPETQQLPAVPVPEETLPVATKLEPTFAKNEPKVQQMPAIAQPQPEPRQLIALPPVTIDTELPIEPPRIKLTVVPPSQRLYQKSGVAFVTVPPEKRPVRPPEESALTPDLSIPLAAERYRSHTATIPFFRFGISW